MPQAFLRCLEGHTCLHHLCRSPVPQKTPRDVRKAKLSGHRLNAPRQQSLVPDRTGLQDTAGLDTIRKHPVLVLRLHPCLQASRRSTSASVSRMGRLVRWYFGVWSLPRFTARTTHNSLFQASRSFPLECQLLQTNAAHRNQSHCGADRLLQTFDQLIELITVWKHRSFFNPFRRKVRTLCRMNCVAFDCLLVEECMHRFDGDGGDSPRE